VGVFRADSSDDILFVADDQTGFGYFKNFGKTRRQGIELGLNGRTGALSFGANHTILDATYQSSETVQGSSNSSNQGNGPGLDGTTGIKPGDRIPLIPQQLFKAYADYRITPAFSMGLNLLAVSSSFARGNENNQHQPDGTYYLGPGKSPGYAVFNLSARYQVEKQLQVFAQINNLFDRKYSTASLLGPSAFNGSGNFQARPFAAVNGEFPLQHSTFFAPGAPRMLWVGVRYSFEKPSAN
jgi:outer membrane receptor protein involved in Fe transport